MAIFKCKMCGGELELQKGMNIAECPYCGTKQTVPYLDDDKKLRLYNRANQYRLDNEFDKAYSAYETIISEKEDEAEAYWGLVLSEYGVEYVEDPATKKRIPTCHRTLVKSVTSNENFKLACQFAESESRMMYEDEAEELDSLQKKILNASAKEDPYDVFLCYKETDDKGERTADSVLAQEIYNELTRSGLRVFFSRISLEDKLGKDYEPCIYAALTSAKVMLMVTADSDHCNAVWVKNEWKRYIDFMKTDREKVLIPVYKDISPYTLPDEFAKLQAQDMSKLGAIQDLAHGVEKIVGKGNGSQGAIGQREKDLLNKLDKTNKRNKIILKIGLALVAYVIFVTALVNISSRQSAFPLFDHMGISIDLWKYGSSLSKLVLLGVLPVFIGFGLNLILGFKSKIANMVYFIAFLLLSIALILLNCNYITASIVVNILYVLLFCIFIITFCLSYKNNFKKGILLCIISCILCLTQFLTSNLTPPIVERDPTKDQIQIKKDFVKFYDKINDDLKGKVYENEIYDVLDSYYDAAEVWYKIEAYNQIGWVGFSPSSNAIVNDPIVFLPRNGIVQSNKTNNSISQLKITTGFINIRTSPSTKGVVIGIVRYGDIYTILEKTGESKVWYKIKTNWGVEGYIYAGDYGSYVSLN